MFQQCSASQAEDSYRVFVFSVSSYIYNNKFLNCCIATGYIYTVYYISIFGLRRVKSSLCHLQTELDFLRMCLMFFKSQLADTQSH